MARHMHRNHPKAPAGVLEWTDRTGIALSLACGVHCAVAPLLIGAAALLPAQWLLSESTEFWLYTGSIGMALSSLLSGYWLKHRRKRCLVFLVPGLTVLGLMLFGLISEQMETWVVVGGACSITVAHFVNIRLCRQCAQCQMEARAEAEPTES